MKLGHDGIQLSFDIAGVGPLQFLFVHGLGGDRSHFAPQMEYFTRQGRALNAELRGHGDSDKPQQAYSIEGFADDLVWLCNRQQIAKPVIVGQSMGGNMALEIAARYPDFPAGLVLLDSGVLFPASAGTVFAGYLEGLRGADFANEVRKIVADSCLPTDRCRAHVEQTFLATPQHVLVSTFTSLFPWDVHRARDCAQACRVPVLYIEAAHRLADLDRFAALCPQLVTAKAVGSGHFLSLEVPEQINPMIDRFISLYVRRPGEASLLPGSAADQSARSNLEPTEIDRRMSPILDNCLSVLPSEPRLGHDASRLRWAGLCGQRRGLARARACAQHPCCREASAIIGAIADDISYGSLSNKTIGIYAFALL